MIREVNSTEIDSNFTTRETQDSRHYSAAATNNQANSHNFKQSLEFTYGDFPGHFKVNCD